MSKSIENISVASHDNNVLDGIQKTGISIGLIGLFIMALALFNINFPNKGIWLTASIVAIFGGIILYANRTYLNKPEGIKNDGIWHSSLTNRGTLAWMVGIILTSFYVVLRKEHVLALKLNFGAGVARRQLDGLKA